jgi:hypothetical protein
MQVFTLDRAIVDRIRAASAALSPPVPLPQPAAEPVPPPQPTLQATINEAITETPAMIMRLVQPEVPPVVPPAVANVPILEWLAVQPQNVRYYIIIIALLYIIISLSVYSQME